MLKLRKQIPREIHAVCPSHSVAIISCDPEDDIEFLADTACQLLMFLKEKEL